MHQALVDQAKRGDREAFDALARTVGDRCMAIAFRILRDADRADDAVQAALIVAWGELRTLRDSDRFEPWLHRILTNECYAEARRRSRWSTAQVRLLPMPGHQESGRDLGHQRSRPAGPGLPEAHAGAEGGARVPPLRRLASSRGGRPSRNPPRDCKVSTSPRNQRVTGEPRGRRPGATASQERLA